MILLREKDICIVSQNTCARMVFAVKKLKKWQGFLPALTESEKRGNLFLINMHFYAVWHFHEITGAKKHA